MEGVYNFLSPTTRPFGSLPSLEGETNDNLWTFNKEA
jgi:hypothetical protein